MQRLNITDPGFETAFARLVDGRRESDIEVRQDVADIIARVRAKVDAALAEYTARFDKHRLVSENDWRIAPEDCRAAYEALAPDLRDALDVAAKRIEA